MNNQRHYAWIQRAPRSSLDFYWFLALIKNHGIKELKKQHEHLVSFDSNKFFVEWYQEGYDFVMDWITVRVRIDTHNK